MLFWRRFTIKGKSDVVVVESWGKRPRHADLRSILLDSICSLEGWLPRLVTTLSGVRALKLANQLSLDAFCEEFVAVLVPCRNDVEVVSEGSTPVTQT